jgi:hypothetical protein
MTAGRYITPPDSAALEESTRRLARSNDALAAKVGHLPLPVPAATVPVSDEQRLVVCRELRAAWLRGKQIDLEHALSDYEREVKARVVAKGAGR